MIIAIAALMLWPVVPLFWIPVHCAPRFFRQIGSYTYILPLITWLPLAFFIYHNRWILLSHKLTIPLSLNIAGGVLLVLGIVLQVWTLMLLSLPGIMGMPEVNKLVKGRLVTQGPFSVVRHPTYLSHTLMLLGVFLSTEVISVGIVTIIDAVVVNTTIIPLEERELALRFGEEYQEYRLRVQQGFFPRIWRRGR